MSTPAQRLRKNARLDEGQDTAFLGCHYCRHYRDGDPPWCAAFPQGIPVPILVGQVDHLERRFDQDNDVVFEEVPNLNSWIEGGMHEGQREG